VQEGKPTSCIAKTEGPWQTLEVLSKTPPTCSANFIPIFWASQLVLLHPYKTGYFALARISADFCVASSNETSVNLPFFLTMGFLILCSLLKLKNLALLRKQPFLLLVIFPSSTVISISSHRQPQKGQTTELIIVSLPTLLR